MKQNKVKIASDQHRTHTMVNWTKALEQIAGDGGKKTATAPSVTQNNVSGNNGDDEWDKAAQESYGGSGQGQ